jgi:hypothetical protein
VDIYSSKRQLVKEEYIGTVELERGANNLYIELIERDEKSDGYGLDLVNIVFEIVE